MSPQAGPTGICEHGYLDGLGCRDCDPLGPSRGILFGLGAMALLALVVVAVFLAGRWVGDHWPDGAPEPVRAAGTWCGQADEVVALDLDQGAAGELNGELSFGGRDFMVVAGRVEEGGIVTLQTVDSRLRFELTGALVGDRLRLDVTDEAGDTGRVELQRC